MSVWIDSENLEATRLAISLSTSRAEMKMLSKSKGVARSQNIVLDRLIDFSELLFMKLQVCDKISKGRRMMKGLLMGADGIGYIFDMIWLGLVWYWWV